MDLGLSLHAATAMDIIAYSDADWVGYPDTRRSTSGYFVYLVPSLISWSSKRQPTVPSSSAKAEYRAIANAVAEVSWLRQLLGELSCPVARPPSSTATMSPRSTSPPTMFIIATPSTSS
jgi:hypothetical protein